MELTLLVGNVGTGKSTYTKTYMKTRQKNTVVVDTDSIIKMFGGTGEYNFDKDKRNLCRQTKIAIIKTALNMGYNVVLDTTNMSKEMRTPYIDIAKELNTRVSAVDFGPGSYESLKRRQSEGRGVTKEQWEVVHNLFVSQYQPPQLSEGFTTIETHHD